MRSMQNAIKERLLEGWSPDQISGRFKLEGKPISHEIIYQYIWRDKRVRRHIFEKFVFKMFLVGFKK